MNKLAIFVFSCLLIGVPSASASQVYPKYAVASENLVEQQGVLPESVDSSVYDYSEIAIKYGDEFRRVDQCGGVIVGPAAVINYKVGQNVSLGELCVWTVHIPGKETIQVRMLQEGFYSNFQTVAIYNTSNPTRYQLRYSGISMEQGDRKVYNVTGGSLIQVFFSSTPYWAEHLRQGFSLLVEGIGPDSNTSDWRVPTISVLEPIDNRIDYQFTGTPTASEGEYTICTIHPEAGKQIALTVESLRSDGRGCIWPNYWYNTLRINEMAYSSSGSIRFQQCDTTNYNTTIYSHVPLVVSTYTFENYYRFQLSWVMV